jgi:uncharacterized protein (DUF2252 family)
MPPSSARRRDETSEDDGIGCVVYANTPGFGRCDPRRRTADAGAYTTWTLASLTMGAPTLTDRSASGRAARAKAPRSSHAAVELGPGRDPIALLEAQNATRVAELVPIRRGRMLASPFAFFRGAAVVMAHDLSALPASGLTVQLSGDAHLANFGGFASPERDLVFDLNDFDETLPGPFEWDVKRLATSFEIAARQRNFKHTERSAVVLRVVRTYREAIRRFAGQGDLVVWYSRLDATTMVRELRDGHDPALVKQLEHSIGKARSNDGRRALATLTHEAGGGPRIVSEPPLIVPLSELTDGTDAISDAFFASYRRSLAPDRRALLDRFRRVDAARKVVGVGSVGTRCWIVLSLGRDERDPLFLEVKEAGVSVLEPVLARSGIAGHGRRVVEGQRLIQAASDIFLGWGAVEQDLPDAPGHFYVRQLRDWKASVDVEAILPQGLARYAEACGWTLARAHARSGDRVALAAYLGTGDTFDRAIAAFASAYADVNERDHRALAQAAADGRIAAVDG